MRSDLRLYQKILGDEFTRLQAIGDINQKIAHTYQIEVETMFEETLAHAIERADTFGVLEIDIRWLDIILKRHVYETLITNYKIAESERELKRTAPMKSEKRFAKPLKPKLPKSLKDLMQLWDSVRKRENVTKRAEKLYESVRKQYVKKVQSVWDQYGQAWRSGDTGGKAEAIGAIQKATKATYNRSKMIVETETTYYANAGRKEYYDKVSEVTHYLFLAVRDHATTKWCTEKTIGGKRGRHGLVFKKETKLFDDNTPPCHWNCRSEITPLTPQNPAHKKFIDDKSRDAERISLQPLPPGWKSR